MNPRQPRELRILVVGMGASAYGRERRAVQALSNMNRIEPFFLISKWEDGSVSRLLREYGLSYQHAPWGYLGRAKPHWTLVTLLHLPQLLWRVVNRCRRDRSHAVLFLSITPFLNALPAMLFLRFVKAMPLVFYFGDVPPQNAFFRLLGRLMSASSRHFVVNSEAVRAGLVGLGIPSKTIQTVYNGVEIERFAAASAHDFRRQFSWPENTTIVAYAGQFNPRKGVEDFLEAAALMKGTELPHRFLVIGRLDATDPYHRRLEARVSSLGLEGEVRFTGWIERMEQALASVDVLVVPSYYEDAAPNVVLEAMASRIPVIGTRAGGIPELIRDGETGILVEKGRPDQIAAGLRRLSREDGLRYRMGAAALENCRSRFDLSRNARMVEEVLQRA